MKRKVITAGAAAVLIVGGGAWLGLGSATATIVKPSFHGWPGAAAKASAASTIASVKADAARTGSQVLLLYSHEGRSAYIDVGEAGFSPGDYFMFEEQLRYTKDGAQIGRDSGRCTVGPRTFLCDVTVQIFGHGKITIYSAGFTETDNRYAVTGGTTLYKDVGGQVDVVDLHHGNALLAFELTR